MKKNAKDYGIYFYPNLMLSNCERNYNYRYANVHSFKSKRACLKTFLLTGDMICLKQKIMPKYATYAALK